MISSWKRRSVSAGDLSRLPLPPRVLVARVLRHMACVTSVSVNLPLTLSSSSLSPVALLYNC